MVRDGRDQFYKYCNFDKPMMKLLNFFRELKTSMLKGKDEFQHGKVYRDTDEKD